MTTSALFDLLDMGALEVAWDLCEQNQWFLPTRTFQDALSGVTIGAWSSRRNFRYRMTSHGGREALFEFTYVSSATRCFSRTSALTKANWSPPVTHRDLSPRERRRREKARKRRRRR